MAAKKGRQTFMKRKREIELQEKRERKREKKAAAAAAKALEASGELPATEGEIGDTAEPEAEPTELE